MQSVFLFHGALDTPESNWLPWLKKELVESGCNVVAPQFPTPEGQNLQNWLSVFEEYEPTVNAQSIFVGHSTGATFVLSILEKLQCPIQASFLVGGFIDPLDPVPLVLEENLNDLVSTFIEKAFDWELIRNRCANYHLFHSDNDPYTPLPRAERIAKHLHADMYVLQNRGHFNDETFPELLEKIRLFV